MRPRWHITPTAPMPAPPASLVLTRSLHVPRTDSPRLCDFVSEASQSGGHKFTFLFHCHGPSQLPVGVSPKFGTHRGPRPPLLPAQDSCGWETACTLPEKPSRKVAEDHPRRNLKSRLSCRKTRERWAFFRTDNTVQRGQIK